MEFSITFFETFVWGVYLLSPIFLILLALICMLGLVVGRMESWQKFDAIYWAFITALTIGYGDIRPLKKRSRILSIVIGCFGLMLGGILVAITVKAASNSLDAHVAIETIQRIKERTAP